MAEKKLKTLLTALQDQGIFIHDCGNRATLQLRADVLRSDDIPEPTGSFELDEDNEAFYIPFRALSAVFLKNRGIDFSKAGVLKKSYKLLKGQTIYPNHDHDVLKWLGYVCKCWYDESENPPGINCTLKIIKDGDMNIRIIKGFKAGALHSVSVEVTFDFEKSHPSLDDWEFWSHLGENVGNEVVRMIATKIYGYGEISIVWQGADGFAKRKDMFSSDPDNDNGSDNNKDNLPIDVPEITGDETVMKLSRTMATLLGIEAALYGFTPGVNEITLDAGAQILFQQDIATKFKALHERNEEFVSFCKDIFGETFKEEKLAEFLTQAKERFDVAEAYLSDTRNEAIKFAKLAEGLTEDGELAKPIANAIAKADVGDVKEMLEMYRRKAEANFTLSCTVCGAALSRASASRGKEPDGSNESGKINKDDFEV
ncbi:MAG: hypothetical protein JXK07_10035 [Spirochaetes bacterium]|nr:hypothetical protein [Spirochaetota bacterium]MBN2771263.1 hypothetical protein [Spirochaetota bacterium]